MLIGADPGVEVARSLYQAAFVASHRAVRCEALPVPAGQLADAIASMRSDASVIGAAVMMPFAVAIAGLLDGLGPEAQSIKAVNTVTHRAGALVGWNTDRQAFSQALEEAGVTAKGKVALVLGAGGAARSCIDVLRQSAAKVWITAPDLDEARQVARDLELPAGGASPLGALSLLIKKVDLIVNATPVGNDGRTTVFPVNWITASQLVIDLIYDPTVTPLVRGARERGARAINGVSMLLHQALASFELWTGEPAPEAEVRASLERAVLARLGT